MTRPEHERDKQSERTTPAPLSYNQSRLPPANDQEGWTAGSTTDDYPGQTLFPPRPWGLGAVLAAIVTALAFLGSGIVILSLAAGENNGNAPLIFNISLSVVVVVVLAAAWLFGPAMHGGGFASLGLKRSETSTGGSLLLPPAILLAVLVFNVVYVVIVNQFGVDLLIPDELPFDEFGPIALTIAGFLVIVAGPFAEEVFFRGFVLRGLTHQWKLTAGLVVSAAIFSIAHASVAIFIPIFVAGLLLGWLYHRTGSLWGCVWVHGAQNAVAFIAAITL